MGSRTIEGGVARVLVKLDRDEMGSPSGVLTHHGIESVEEVLGYPLAGSVPYDGEFEKFGVGKGLELLDTGIIGSSHGGMVEVFVYPVGQIVQFTEIDDEAMLVRLVGPKG